MNKLVIIGARAMARETYRYAVECGMDVKGFLDSDRNALASHSGYPEIIGNVESYSPKQEDVFVCALGNPMEKMRYVDLIRSKAGRFTSIVHPTAYVGQNVSIGEGCVIAPHATITCDAVIGNHVIMNVNATFSHDSRCGEGTTISPGCNIAGRCSLGARVFLGIGAILLPDVALGDDVFVAAGACVTQSFEAGRVMGVPAKRR